MMKEILRFSIVVFSALVLGLLGLLIGAYIGGNFAQGFQFLGVRGYEAASQVGFIVGAALGALISWKRMKNKCKNKDV